MSPTSMNSASEELLSSAKAGDLAALSQLIQMHRYGLYRYGLRVCRTTEDAEDALQETLWAVTRAIKMFRGSATSIVSWMFTIIRRECFRLIERHRPSQLDLDSNDESSSPEDELLKRRRVDLLSAALCELEPVHREVILLRDIQELTAPEAALKLGISVEAMKSRLHRARINLREQISKRSDS